MKVEFCWEYLFQIIPVSDKYPLLRYWKYWRGKKLLQINWLTIKYISNAWSKYFRKYQYFKCGWIHAFNGFQWHDVQRFKYWCAFEMLLWCRRKTFPWPWLRPGHCFCASKNHFPIEKRKNGNFMSFFGICFQSDSDWAESLWSSYLHSLVIFSDQIRQTAGKLFCLINSIW